jgi:catechol 2,3-dioxygenase-like lactoylglutathione lyase family enzyme
MFNKEREMEKSNFSHVVAWIDLKNIGFYKDLFQFLEWSVLYDDPKMLGVGDEHGGSLWFGEATKDVKNDYDAKGVNHIGIAVKNQGDVDATVDFLKKRSTPSLFETPRHRPEFSGPDSTYYQVMFESPDRLLFEVVYTGPKKA